jgi:hypothetical protein
MLRRHLVTTLLISAAILGGSTPRSRGAQGVEAADTSTEARPREPLFEGLGLHGRRVTTTSPEAQRYFDQA